MNVIRLIKPYVSFVDVEAEFRDVLDSGILTRGKYADAFRDQIAHYTGAPHAFLTTSATTSLWVCLKLLGVGPSDDVIVSDFSFPATANVVEDLGARPVFADVSLDTYNMQVQALESLITSHTKAVIFVDALGNPTGLTEIAELCRQHGIPLIEDAACAIGSTEGGRHCGEIADVTCFSFHPRKLIATGEGGAITTARPDWAKWLSVKLAHGADGMRGPGLDFVDFGYNFRMSELQSVLGLKQLARLDDIVIDRNNIRESYIKHLESLGFIAQQHGPDVVHNVQSLAFRVPTYVNRDGLIAGLKERHVEATIGTYCQSATTYFARRYGHNCPNAKLLEASTITLPCYQDVDVAYVCDAVTDFLGKNT